MKEDCSARFKRAIQYILDNRLAKSDTEIAKTIGTTRSTISMACNGYRQPTAEQMARLCDHYPISFDWLRKNEGTIVPMDTAYLLNRIESLEREIERLRNK